MLTTRPYLYPRGHRRRRGAGRKVLLVQGVRDEPHPLSRILELLFEPFLLLQQLLLLPLLLQHLPPLLLHELFLLNQLLPVLLVGEAVALLGVLLVLRLALPVDLFLGLREVLGLQVLPRLVLVLGLALTLLWLQLRRWYTRWRLLNS